MSAPYFQQQISAERIRPTLRGTAFRAVGGDDFNRLVLLSSGDVTSRLSADDLPFEAPVGFLLRPQPDLFLRFGPGTEGWILGIAPALMAEAVGRSAESVLLHSLAGYSVVVRPADTRLEDQYLRTAGQIADEIQHPRKGSEMAIVALLRLLLIAFLREDAQDEVSAPALDGEAELLRRFRRLVEMNFRSQLGIAEYADLLGIKYDRLHNICRRGLQRTPLQLVHQRMMREAVLRLERTDQSIHQIAWSLGFVEASRFSHFFKRAGGRSPTEYRQWIRQEDRPAGMAELSFSDWP